MEGKEMTRGEQATDEKTLEEMFEELEKVIGIMEQPEITLEESFRLYHEGMDMLKTCGDRIDRIEKKMLAMDEEGELHEFR